MLRGLVGLSVMHALSLPANGQTIEGLAVEPYSMCHGTKLVLNGAGLRKRGYYKANVVALYLPEKTSNPEAVYKLTGLRRIKLHILRDFGVSTLARIFLADFKQVATEQEFKQLIPEVAELGRLYSLVGKVSAGDVLTVDWLPGTGIETRFNDRLLGEKPMNSELAYQIYLRMFIGDAVPVELRSALLGIK